jgi:hypothetical protein
VNDPQKTLETYLRRKAEPEAQAADRLEGRFGHALVIPAYGEGENLFATLGSVPRGPLGEVLIVLVLNARADSPECVHETNRATRDRLLVAGAARPLAGDAGILQVPLPHGRLILVDRARPGGFLPEGQGVGLARKLGADLALRARADGRLASDWIHTTDADALLPDDYFDRTEGVAEAAAAVYPFEHRFDPDERLARAARLHEIALRYRVLGLAWAGSPYAYQSLGSCLAVRSAPYTDVGGFPRRDATEDFHLLNRLARTGAIARLPGKPIVVEGRVSDRVRVSTGREVARLSGKGAETFRLLHPAVFAHLAAWLEVLNAIARDPHDLAGAISRLPSESTFFRRELLTTSLERLDASVPSGRRSTRRPRPRSVPGSTAGSTRFEPKGFSNPCEVAACLPSPSGKPSPRLHLPASRLPPRRSRRHSGGNSQVARRIWRASPPGSARWSTETRI